MSTAVLLCGRTGIDAGAVSSLPAATIDDLCTRPAAAGSALQDLGATRVVLGLCERPSHDLLAALRRAGAEPFGVETVLFEDEATAAAQVAAAAAKLEALPADERGRPHLVEAAISRRTLFSRVGILAHAPVARLDADACFGSDRCGLCVDACGGGAIDAAGPAPEVDSARCSACAACVTACPAGALRLVGASARQVEAQLEQLLPVATGVVFACTDAEGVTAEPGWARVELPTLALVTPGWILQLRSRGLDARLAACGRCRDHASAVEAFAARLLARPARRSARAEPIRLAEPAATVDVVAALETPAVETTIRGVASPLGLLSLDTDRCTLCGACANVCPTAALALAETGARTTVRHRPAACVACGRCVGACPEAALAVERGVDVARVARGELDLLGTSRESCRRCGEPLPPRALRSRLRQLLPTLAEASLDLCAPCAAGTGFATSAGSSNTIDPRPSDAERKETPAWQIHGAS